MQEGGDVYMLGDWGGPLCHAVNRVYVRWIRVRDNMQGVAGDGRSKSTFIELARTKKPSLLMISRISAC
jgi:hypothetical protein